MLVSSTHDSILDPHGLEPCAPLFRHIRLVCIHRHLIPTHQLVRHLRIIHVRRGKHCLPYQPRTRIQPDMRLVTEVRFAFARPCRVGSVSLLATMAAALAPPLSSRPKRALFDEQPPLITTSQLLEQAGAKTPIGDFLPEAAVRVNGEPNERRTTAEAP